MVGNGCKHASDFCFPSDRLADQGHSVVGIDLVPKAIAGFIENNSLQATTSSATTDDGDSLAVHKVSYREMQRARIKKVAVVLLSERSGVGIFYRR